MRNSVIMFVALMAIIFATASCKKNNDATPIQPRLVQANENDVFYFQGKTTLWDDWQVSYNFRGGSFYDPYINSTYSADTMTLLSDTALQVRIHSVYTGATADIIAVKIPIKYDQYGEADQTINLNNPFRAYNGLVRMNEKRVIYAFDSERQTILLYFLDTRELLTKDWVKNTDQDGLPVIEILDMPNGETWFIQHNICSASSFQVPAIRVECPGKATQYTQARIIDDKRTRNEHK